MTAHKEWTSRAAPGLDEFEAIARDVFCELADDFHSVSGGLVIRVDDFPSAEVIEAMALDSEFDILGLFQGVGQAQRGDPATGEMPNLIWLYRRPILDYWATYEETLGHIVAHVLIHEIGHHLGFSDEDMERIETAYHAL